MQPDPTELLNKSPLAIIICDASERIQWCNTLFFEQTSLSEPEIYGQLFASLPLEAIDNKAQLVQLFSQNSGDGQKFHYWCKSLENPADGKAHYLAIQRENPSKLAAIASKLGHLTTPKKSWVEFLNYEVSRSRRYNNPLSLLKLHLYFVRPPKDEYLDIIHDNVQDAISDQLRWADMLGHTEQGSYLMVLPETPIEAVPVLQQKVSESLHHRLKKLDFKLNYQLIFASAYWQQHDDSKKLLARARANLVSELEQMLAQLG